MYATTAKIELTMNCTHQCGFCYNPARSGIVLPGESGLKDATAQTLNAVIAKLVAYGIEKFIFTGGEPFTRRDLLYCGIETVKDMHRTASVTSNLSLCTQEDAQRLANLGLPSLLTSFYSHERDLFNHIARARTYDRVVEGIQNMSSAGIPLSVNIPLTTENLEGTYATVKFLFYDKGVRSISITPVTPTTTEQVPLLVPKDKVLALFDQVLDLSETAGFTFDTLRPTPYCMFPPTERYRRFTARSCVVEPGDGDITVNANGFFKICSSIPAILGNVLLDNIDMLLERGLALPVFDGARPDDCLDCTVWEACRSGCPIEDDTLVRLGLSHPYIDPSHPVTNARLLPRVAQLKLLHYPVSFDSNTDFTPQGDGWEMHAYGKTTTVSSADVEVITALAKDPNVLPWDVAIALALKKNELNGLLHFLQNNGVIKIGNQQEVV
ncbi:radical SAM protein [Candidatus Woesearchaeota archaeon]|nr:radical SAM protein [Candidatus Woesearchaeota archaeon]